jgi:hypothetical protein
LGGRRLILMLVIYAFLDILVEGHPSPEHGLARVALVLSAGVSVLLIGQGVDAWKSYMMG